VLVNLDLEKDEKSKGNSTFFENGVVRKDH